MAWLVVILMIVIILSLGLALRYLVFKSATTTTKDKDPTFINNSSNDENCAVDKKVVSWLTLRIILSTLLLLVCYLYLSSFD
jgi:hypothetical protein